MNIALAGYGKMGRLMEARALERGHRITAIIDPFAAGTVSASGAPVAPSIAGAGEALDCAGVVIEFTRPDTAPENILALAARRVPVLTGTTGWYARLDEMAAAVEKAGSSLLWAPNFSLGVNLLYRIAEYAAKIIDPFADYDVGGWEAHHNKKADSPSGTAKTLVAKVLAQMTRKKRALYGGIQGAPEADVIHFPSLRAGSLPGTHSLLFDSPADTIEITHTARSREGFAAGAMRAAEWLLDCPGPGQPAGTPRRGVYTMDDVLADILG